MGGISIPSLIQPKISVNPKKTICRINDRKNGRNGFIDGPPSPWGAFPRAPLASTAVGEGAGQRPSVGLEDHRKHEDFPRVFHPKNHVS